MSESITHVLYKCKSAKTIWKHVKSLLTEKNIEIELTCNNIILNTTDSQLTGCIVLLTKHFLYKNRCKKTKPHPKQTRTLYSGNI